MKPIKGLKIMENSEEIVELNGIITPFSILDRWNGISYINQ
jgi:hypothetical protein